MSWFKKLVRSMTGAPSQRIQNVQQAQVQQRQAQADAEGEALRRIRERGGRRGLLGFVDNLSGSKTLGGGS